MHINNFLSIFYVTESKLPSAMETVLNNAVLSLREQEAGHEQLHVLQPSFGSFIFEVKI